MNTTEEQVKNAIEKLGAILDHLIDNQIVIRPGPRSSYYNIMNNTRTKKIQGYDALQKISKTLFEALTSDEFKLLVETNVIYDNKYKGYSYRFNHRFLINPIYSAYFQGDLLGFAF